MGGVHVEVCSNTLFCVENCRTDVTPFDDDDKVDVNDLLAIINNWGPCPKPETLDQDVQDCMDYATNELELVFLAIQSGSERRESRLEAVASFSIDASAASSGHPPV